MVMNLKLDLYVFAQYAINLGVHVAYWREKTKESEGEMNKEQFLIECIDKKIQSSFNKTWKQILNEKERDYEIVYNDVYEEALITYTIDYINRYINVKKNRKIRV